MTVGADPRPQSAPRSSSRRRIERAFAVFTEDIGSWWPPDHHLLEAELAEMVFETHEGGHELGPRGVDGSECRWARVLVYEPRAGS